MTKLVAEGKYFPMSKEGLFWFNLEPYDVVRNEELKRAFINCSNPDAPDSPKDTYVVLGGLHLPVKSFTPKQVKFEIKTRNWLSRAVLGLQSTRRTERVNKDGSITVIVEKTVTRRDGTKVVTTEETTTGIPFVSTTSKRREMTDQNNVFAYDETQPDKYPVNATDATGKLKDPRERVDHGAYYKSTKTVATPPDQDIEYVHEKTEMIYPPAPSDTSSDKHSVYQGDATVRSKVSEYRYVHNKEPLRLAKPVTLVSITGKVINQFLLPNPPQGKDDTWWNDGMGNNETKVPDLGYPHLDKTGANGNSVVTTTYTRDLGDGTQEVKTDVETTNPDGEKTVESTSVIRNTGELYTPETFQVTTKEPLKTTVEKKFYDKLGAHVRTEKTTTTPLHKDTNALPPATLTINEVSDERGKKTITHTKKWKDSDGKDNEEVVEEIAHLGRHVSTKSISEQIDNETKIKTISTTTTVTDALGNSYTEEETKKEFVGDTVSTTEQTNEQLDDLIINELVVGTLVTEYRISGEFMTADQAYRIMDKHVQHQNAWAMFELLNAQLDLGEKVSPKLLNELFKQQMAIYSGGVEPVEVKPGVQEKRIGSRFSRVLDRIAFVGFTDKLNQSEGVVFAPGADSFNLEWIDGTDKIFKWSMVLHKYDNLVQDTQDLGYDDPTLASWDIPVVLGGPVSVMHGLSRKLPVQTILNGP
jgi:hypothetical protein